MVHTQTQGFRSNWSSMPKHGHADHFARVHVHDGLLAGHPLAQVPQVRQRFRLPSGTSSFTKSFSSLLLSLILIASDTFRSSNVLCLTIPMHDLHNGGTHYETVSATAAVASGWIG
jgi:hypothetical protein